jgi:methyl-accepting chemotaxis protein
MTFDIDRVRRLDSMAIDDRTRTAVRDALPLITAHIDSAIDAAYRQIMRFPEAAKVYQTVSMKDVHAAQRKHLLEDLFTVTFTQQQVESIVELFQRRQKMGLGLRWYFVFYSTLLRTLLAKIGPAYRKKPEQLLEVTNALTSVLQFDLELAAASYMQASEDHAATFIKGSTDELQTKVGRLTQSVSAATAQLRSTAQGMATVADQTAGQASSASTASQVAEDNIQAAAAATDQLTASINEISRQVGQSAQIATSAVSEAKRTDSMVQGLAETVGKIGAVVKLINDIASQTNLLALNATIEAARAGDAGKGFAVVAGEVKNLANQTARATDEISSQIAAVQSATKDAVNAIQGIGGTIVRISEIASAIASAVEEQGAATQEISRSVRQAADSGTTVHANIRAVSTTAETTKKNARDLLSGVDSLATGLGSLQHELDGLSTQVSRFLDQVRSR